jgi:hypothetical protein
MVIAVVSMHDSKYAYLSPYTWNQNGKLYCEKWNYPYFILENPGDDLQKGFIKVRYLIELCESNPQVEWIFWKDCDGLITNFNIRLEEIVDNDYHVILTTHNNGINNGMMFIRNSPQGRDYLRMIYQHVEIPMYRDGPGMEQAVQEDTLEANRSIIKIVPQRTFNAVPYSDFSHGRITSRLDRLGTEGHWQEGDFVMHWPGELHEERLRVCLMYLPRVIR